MQKLWTGLCCGHKFGRRDEIPPNALAVPKSVFSNAMTVMDKVEGWNEDNMGGFEILRDMHVALHIEAVLCNGQGPTPEDLRRKLSTIVV